MTQTLTTDERKARLLASQSTPALALSALMLDTLGPLMTPEERLTRAWVCDELERRHPEVTPALEAWVEALEFDTTGTGPSYVETLIAALPASAVTK